MIFICFDYYCIKHHIITANASELASFISSIQIALYIIYMCIFSLELSLYTSKAKWLCLIEQCLFSPLPLSALSCHLGIVINIPGVLKSSLLASGHLSFHHLHSLFLLLLHHLILLSHCDTRDNDWDTLDKHKNDASHESILEGDTGSTSDRENTSCEEPCSDCVPWIIFLPVVDKKAVYWGEDAAPHSEGTTKEGGTITDMSQSTQDLLSSWGVPKT